MPSDRQSDDKTYVVYILVMLTMMLMLARTRATTRMMLTMMPMSIRTITRNLRDYKTCCSHANLWVHPRMRTNCFRGSGATPGAG